MEEEEKQAKRREKRAKRAVREREAKTLFKFYIPVRARFILSMIRRKARGVFIWTPKTLANHMHWERKKQEAETDVS